MALDRDVMEGMCQRNLRSSNLVRPKVRDLRLKGVWSPVSSVESRHYPRNSGASLSLVDSLLFLLWNRTGGCQMGLGWR